MGIHIFSERVRQVSKHDEEHNAGPTKQNDGASYDGTLAKETEAKQYALAWGSSEFSWPQKCIPRYGRTQRTYDGEQAYEPHGSWRAWWHDGS